MTWIQLVGLWLGLGVVASLVMAWLCARAPVMDERGSRGEGTGSGGGVGNLTPLGGDGGLGLGGLDAAEARALLQLSDGVRWRL